MIVSACSGIPERPALRDDLGSLDPSGEGGSGGSGALSAGEAGTPSVSAAGAAGAGGTQGGGGEGGAPEPECGDGERTEDELCDDGNVTPGDGCDEECAIEPAKGACGNGEVKDWEECDDGNLTPGDGCDNRCRRERCGNEREDAGEECDPPDLITCGLTCQLRGPRCGDRVIQENDGEECDDGNIVPGDGCHVCRITCGDGRIDRAIGEECEPEYSTPEQCSEECRWLPVCGDGEVQPEVGEECDPSDGVDCIDCSYSGHAEGGEGGSGGENAGGAGAGGGNGEPAPGCVPMTTDQLVTNGNFDSDFSGWQPHDATLVSLSIAEDGAPAPRALEVRLASGPTAAASGAYQCVPVQSGRQYNLEARYLIPNDAPQGVAASISAFLYAGTSCSGTIVGTPAPGPEGTGRGVWTPYQLTVDTNTLSGEGRLLVRLDVMRPAEVTGSRVLWDSVSLAQPGGLCGNCSIDSEEQCDDGNRAPGDQCSASCKLEICGDGKVEPSEECDDGNVEFGIGPDACTPGCRVPTECDECAATSCTVEAIFCLNLTRRAEAGPRAKTAQSTLCDELRTCVQESNCHRVERLSSGTQEAFLENCYCGSAGEGCFSSSGAANGSCKTEVEAALETTDPSALLGRFEGADARYPVFAALRELLACEGTDCATQCVSDSVCGNGRVQDRNFAYVFEIDGEEVPCADQLTHSGRGCSFEECDDGNLLPGDGCDESCFVEACGNNVVQLGEECDDGNRTTGDGCNSECQAEFHCADSLLEPPYEECDPPGSGLACTQAQFDSNPAQCACDARCKRVVCGKHGLQVGEQCDPPNGINCDAQCQLLEAGPCEACLNSNAELAEANAALCNSDTECVAVKQCVVDARCMVPPLSPSSCYCGPNVDDCDQPDFEPTGPCREVIVTGVGGTPTNEQVNVALGDTENSSGAAIQLLSFAFELGVCRDECFPGWMP